MSVKKPFSLILFRDYNGYWCPLKSLFFSTSSRVLVSREVNSCVEEVISHYCPQCLTRYAEDDVLNYLNRCPSCFQCPFCEAPLVVEANNRNDYVLVCNTCLWNSDENGLRGKDKSDLETYVRKLEKDKAASVKIYNAFEKVLQSQDSFGNQSVKQILSDLSEMHVLKNESSERVVWHMEDLARKLENSGKSAMASVPVIPLDKFPDWQKQAKEAELSSYKLCFSANRDSKLTSVTQRFRSLNSHSYGVDQLLPPRIELQSKRTVRCRKDMELRRMNILLQPKIFPLEGDSSLKIQKGKWWVKDSSAIHEVPFYTVKKLPKVADFKKGPAYLEVAVFNPKDVDLKITFSIEAEIYGDELDGNVHDEYMQLEYPDVFGTLGSKSPNPTRELEIASPPNAAFGEANYISLTINAYEDELLMDEDKEVSRVKIVKSNSVEMNEKEEIYNTDLNNSVEESIESAAKEAENMGGNEPFWTATVDRNVALFKIPVKLPQNELDKLLKWEEDRARDPSSVPEHDGLSRTCWEVKLNSQLDFGEPRDLNSTPSVEKTAAAALKESGTNILYIPVRIIFPLMP